MAVTIGIAPLRRAWRRITADSPMPFARAVRRKSWFSTSSMLERVMRAVRAIAQTPRVTVGRTSVSQPSPPYTGTHRRFTANARIRRMPSQNVGMHCPASASAMAPESRAEPRGRPP